MSRFDVYLPRGGALLLDVQADHLYLLATRIVVPLVASPVLPLTTGDLMPAFDVNGQRRIMASTLLFSILHRRLGPPVGNLSMHRDQITRALDLLLTGF